MIAKIKNLIISNAAFDIGYYFSAKAIKAVIPFLILPILTVYLSPSEYGIWSIYLAIYAFTMPFIAFGLPMILARNYHMVEPAEHGRMFFTSLVCMLFFALIMTIIFGAYSFFSDSFMNILILWLLIIPITGFIENISYLNKVILAHENRAKLFFFLEVGNSIFNRVLGLCFVVYISANWTSLLVANIITQLSFALISLYILLKEGKIIYDWTLKRALNLLNMGWPIIGHVIGAIIITLSDRFILQIMTTEDDVGIYSLAANLGAGVLVFCTAFNQKWGPWLYRQLKDPTEKGKIKIVKYTYLYFIAAAISTIAIILISKIYISFFIDPSYNASTNYIVWLCFASLFYGMSLAISHYIVITGHTKILPIITISSALVNLILTIMFVHYIGVVGAAIATCLSYAFLLISTWIINYKYYPMPWKKALLT